jgi:6-phosphogluconate dehydrogenase
MTAAHFAMIGLGTMGRNFLLNIADSGFGCAGYDLDPAKRELLLAEGREWNVAAAESPEELAGMLERPRIVMLLVPAGPIVDSVIEELLPFLSAGDLIIDGGNSHFSDTDRRERYLAEKGIGFLGVGVSGGEEGARMGASIMPGGRREYYDRVAPIFESVAAKVDGQPCVCLLYTSPSPRDRG